MGVMGLAWGGGATLETPGTMISASAPGEPGRLPTQRREPNASYPCLSACREPTEAPEIRGAEHTGSEGRDNAQMVH